MAINIKKFLVFVVIGIFLLSFLVGSIITNQNVSSIPHSPLERCEYECNKRGFVFIEPDESFVLIEGLSSIQNLWYRCACSSLNESGSFRLYFDEKWGLLSLSPLDLHDVNKEKTGSEIVAKKLSEVLINGD